MNRIKEIADQKGVRISDIIKLTGLSRSFVYDIINENSFPTIPTGQKIASALGSTLDDVFPDNGLKGGRFDDSLHISQTDG